MLQPIGQLFGKSLKHQKLPHFELSEGVYNSKTITPFHSHDWSLLCLVLKGSYTENRGAKLYTRQPSTLFFLPAGEPHVSDFSSAKVGIFRIEINPERLAQMDEARKRELFRRLTENKGNQQEVRRTFREVFPEDKLWADEAPSQSRGETNR